MSRILAALLASVCMLTLASVPAPANAASVSKLASRGGDGWCC